MYCLDLLPLPKTRCKETLARPYWGPIFWEEEELRRCSIGSHHLVVVSREYGTTLSIQSPYSIFLSSLLTTSKIKHETPLSPSSFFGALCRFSQSQANAAFHYSQMTALLILTWKSGLGLGFRACFEHIGTTMLLQSISYTRILSGAHPKNIVGTIYTG